MASSQHRCVFVGNIPYDATEEQLIQICEEVGPVVSFRLVLDRETGKPKGYGFCEYKDEETALSARRNLQGYEINGRQLRVDFAENDKNADRNKEQGRGGPGLIGNFDPQKTLASATFNQPIGLALAASAASMLAVALNNGQASNVGSVQNGFPNQLGLGSDPITLYLAKISRNQLHEILSEMQTLAKQNQPLARQVLLACPQLAKAIFQALIMLGMVPTQMLQIPNIRQTPATANTPSLHEGQFLSSQQIQQHRLQTGLQVGLTEKLQEVASLGQNSVVQSPSVQNTQGQTGPHVVSQTQIQIPVQLAQSGGTPLSVHPLTSLPVFRSQTPAASSIPLYQKIQPSLPPQQPRPVGYTVPVNVQSAVHGTVAVQPFSAHSISNQGPLKTATAIAAVQATDFRESGGSVPSISAMHSNFSSEAVDKRFSADTSDMPHPSKVSKLDGGTGPSSMMGAKILPGVPPLPASTAGTSSVAANQISKFNATPKTEQEVPQLSPEVESVLLQQVMNLTPEQLNSLPPEQRQQVLQLQQMLR